MPLSLRALVAADAPLLCPLVECVLPNTWGPDAVAAELERADARVWGAFSGAELAGFAMLRLVLDEAELTLIGVAPAARRRGVATALWAEVAARLGAEQIAAVFLEVRASNDAARALYGRLGFDVVGVRRGYYRRPEEDAVVLRRAVP